MNLSLWVAEDGHPVMKIPSAEAVAPAMVLRSFTEPQCLYTWDTMQTTRDPVGDAFPAYQPPLWLPGGHAQTIWPALIKGRPPAYRRERWTTPDGDFIDLDWVDAAPDSPLVVMFHGLEGSSASHYAASLMHSLHQIGWAGVVPHFRGCSGEPNRLPRAYHSGDTDEIDWILRRLAAVHPRRALFAAGVSLGGNALAKWLGEREEGAARLVAAAAVVSAPFDLAVSGHHLGRGFNRIYTRHFLATLKQTAREKLARFPGLFDAERLRTVRSLYEFDDLVTAPLHGFAGAADYWRRASAKPWLRAIRVPTLLLNAQNDPFLPAHALPATSELSSQVVAEFPRHGGHVGFVTSHPPGQPGWLPQRLLRWFTARHP